MIAYAVAIPARDEEERIGVCLAALAAQRPARPALCLVFVNNSRDATAARARAIGLPPPWELVVEEGVLPAGLAHAGGARRTALERARARACPDTLLVTTDADGKAHPHWLEALGQARRAHGADAVAGRVEGDAQELALLDPAALALGRLEGDYALAVAQLEHALDPLAHDPWPRHSQASGANLACTVEVWDRVGGLPPAPVSEDRAFVDRLLLSGARVRHDPTPLVVVSARLDGRAPGGMATTLQRLHRPDYRCDRALQPAAMVARRLGLRGEARRAHGQGELGSWLARRGWPRPPGLDHGQPFERLWRWLEPRVGLARGGPRLRPAELDAELRALRALLDERLSCAA